MSNAEKQECQQPAPIQSAELVELRKLANCATAGPWYIGSKHTVGPRSDEDDQTYGMVIPIADIYGDSTAQNEAFIAAANPAVILRLLDALATSARPAQEQAPSVPEGAGVRKARELLPKLHSLFNRLRNPSNVRIKCEEDSRAIGDASELCRTIIKASEAAPPAAIAAPMTDEDKARLDFIEAHPERKLHSYKKGWSFEKFTNYEYDTFPTVREAVDAAMVAHLTRKG